TTAPYLRPLTNITEANTRIPIETSVLLVHFNNLVKSVNTDSLKTVVNELGTAFAGTGQDLGRIIDTSTEFIQTADANIDTTRALIRDSDSVLQTQIDKQGALGTFATNLALFSDTLVAADPDLRRLADGAAPAAKEVRQVVDENAKDLSVLINNLITVNRPAFENTQAVRALFVLFPYLLEGGPSTIVDNGDGTFDAAFGIVTTSSHPVCNQGYRSDRRAPDDIDPDRGLDTDVDCTDEGLVARNPSKTEKNRAPVAGYDPATGTTTTDATGPSYSDPLAFGKDTWQWLLLGPATTE
ncbi:MAG: MCE family protein, partial [Aeromicrobium sp.]